MIEENINLIKKNIRNSITIKKIMKAKISNKGIIYH